MGVFEKPCETSREAFEAYAASDVPGACSYEHVSEEKLEKFHAAAEIFKNLFEKSENTKEDFAISIRDPDSTHKGAGGFLWQKTVDVDGSGFYLTDESLLMASEFLKNVDRFSVTGSPHPDNGVSSIMFEWRVDDVRF